MINANPASTSTTKQIFTHELMKNVQSMIVHELKLKLQERINEKFIFSLDKKTNKFIGITGQQYLQLLERGVQSLKSLGLKPNQNVVLISENSVYADLIEKSFFDCFANSIVLDPDVSSKTLNEIISNYNPKLIIGSNYSLLKNNFLNELHLTPLEDLFDKYDNIDFNLDREKNFYNNTNNEFKDEIYKNLNDLPALTIFTSGTTGSRLAVQYSQRQFLETCLQINQHHGGFGKKHITISWLPLSPLFQRIVNLTGLLNGFKIYFWSEPQDIIKALTKVKPTLFIAVPRFYQKLYNQIEQKTLFLSRWPVPFSTPLKKYIHQVLLRNFFKINKTILLSGSAALGEETELFFNSMGLKIYQAYGLTECILPIAMNTPLSNTFRSVGKVLKNIEIKIDSEEQIWIRGPFAAKTYDIRGTNKDTLNVLKSNPMRWSNEGWFQTGDLGFINADGFLFLNGRLSEIIKLSTGKKISRTKIEVNIYSQLNSMQKFNSSLQCIDQILIFGNERPFLIAMICLKGDGNSKTDLAFDLLNFVKAFNAGQSKHEQIPKFIILNRPLEARQQELTSNLKVRYNFIESKIKKHLDDLYESKDLFYTVIS